MSDTPPPVSQGALTMSPGNVPLPPLCTVGDVTLEMMGPLSDAQAAAADRFIQSASALIRRWCGQSFTLLTTTNIIILRADGKAVLPQRPVTNISYVAVINRFRGETPLVGWWWDKVDTIDLCWDRSLIVNAPAWWADEPPDTVKVTYTHGYCEIPPEVSGVCAAVVVRRLTEPAAHLRTTKIGEYSEMYYDAQSPGSVYLTGDDKLALADFRPSGNTIRLA